MKNDLRDNNENRFATNDPWGDLKMFLNKNK